LRGDVGAAGVNPLEQGRFVERPSKHVRRATAVQVNEVCPNVVVELGWKDDSVEPDRTR
jgi:hypothetical protein